MSSTNRGVMRDHDDYYATPPPLAALICDRIAADLADPEEVVNVLEPGCGGGSFLQAARAAWPYAEVIGVEINPQLAEKARSKGFTVHHADLLERGERPLLEELPDFHVIVGNPPFRHAEEFIHALLPRLDPDHGILAFVLRLNFLGGGARYEKTWSTRPPSRVYILPARPGFTANGGSDSIEYMVAVWHARPRGPTTLHWLDNRRIENKWAKGTYEDPRKDWFPTDQPTARQTITLE